MQAAAPASCLLIGWNGSGVCVDPSPQGRSVQELTGAAGVR